jgi:hypothetical protein
MFSIQAVVFSLLFILLSSRRAYVLTGNYVDGMIQMVIHGLLLFYIFAWVNQGLPQNGTKVGPFINLNVISTGVADPNGAAGAHLAF